MSKLTPFFAPARAGTASRTSALVDSNNVSRTAAQFLASDSDDATSGALTVRNNNGLTVGLTDNNVVKVTAEGVVNENNVSNQNYTFRMTTSGGKADAMTIDSANSRIGIYNTNPTETLDVGGNMRVGGNLIVDGDTTATHRIEHAVHQKVLVGNMICFVEFSSTTMILFTLFRRVSVARP